MMRKTDEYIWNHSEHAFTAKTYGHRLDETSASRGHAGHEGGQHAVDEWGETDDEKPSARDVPETLHSYWPAELTESGTALLLRRVPENLSFRHRPKPPKTFPRFLEMPAELQVMVFRFVILSWPNAGKLDVEGDGRTWYETILRSAMSTRPTQAWVFVSKSKAEYRGAIGLLETCRLSRSVLVEWWKNDVKRRPYYYATPPRRPCPREKMMVAKKRLPGRYQRTISLLSWRD